MSSAEVAVQVFRKLENEDLRVLQVIETAMSKHEFVPKEQIAKFSEFSMRETDFRLSRLNKLWLIRQTRGAYVGHTLNYAGYDCLAINALVKASVLEAFGKPLGVGKEADVYDALSPERERIAVKFHRLGRISFRQTRRKRNYTAQRVNWLFQSRRAAEKEFKALKLVSQKRVAVPRPISQNRHVIVMGMIEGAELAEWKEIPKPTKILEEILFNIRKAYIKAGVIHADLSEYNVILKPNMRILIIDWPQYVTKEHPNAQQLLARDVKNILGYFERKRMLKTKLKKALAYVTGNSKAASF
ncbi:MAG: AarF/UbiB family protein [Candidatus Bathyarchaeota archaeon]|nr:AarF/UbiB family protein [Candidatus Bathyarchaeota archaeon]MDH5787163.1 AarF/UbiB family protein [Candidatus Bathyarchaeota archaeon]